MLRLTTLEPARCSPDIQSCVGFGFCRPLLVTVGLTAYLPCTSYVVAQSPLAAFWPGSTHFCPSINNATLH
ncbi:hypothetical protein RSAG8_01011, partial [Rhizoctonia solani AG-8 WAC10335]